MQIDKIATFAIGFLVVEAIVNSLTTVFAVQYDNWRRGAHNYLFIEHLFVVFVVKILVAVAVYLFFHGRLIIGQSIYTAIPFEEGNNDFWIPRINEVRKRAAGVATVPAAASTLQLNTRTRGPALNPLSSGRAAR